MKFVIVVMALMAAVLVSGDQPVDLPCVTWEPLQAFQPTPDPSDLFLAAYTWVIGTPDGDQCLQKGDIFPCFASDRGISTWGHHDYLAGQIPNDYCRTFHDGQVYLSNSMYIPKKGPKYETWKWQLAQTGGKVPDNAIRFGSSVMARSTYNPTGMCCGKGFTGWAVGNPNGTFGDVHFTIQNTAVTTHTFEVAICEAYHPTPAPTTPAPETPAPETPVPTASPTLPPNNKPYIRFGHAIPADHNVDVVISQANASHTWTNYAFGQFSGWVEVFATGDGTIEVYENVKGTRGSLLVKSTVYLTPGPLVAVLKDYWPPKETWNIEMIAASYVPVASGSGVRLVNLSPDTVSAGMKDGNNTLVNNIKYQDSSVWADIPVKEATFNVFDSQSQKALTSDTFTPPPAPFVFTNFLIGLQNATTGSKYTTRCVPLIDAPEQ